MNPPLTSNGLPLRGGAAGGPVFEPAPGWGGQIKNWVQENKLFTGVVSALVVVLVIFLIAGGMPNSQDISTIPPLFHSPSPTPPVVSVLIVKGDSYTTVARHLITEYIKTHPDEGAPTNGQRLFAETAIANEITHSYGFPLTVGQPFEYNPMIIKEILAVYPNLSAKQKAQWESWASRIKF